MHLRINIRLQWIDESNKTMRKVEEFDRWILQVRKVKCKEFIFQMTESQIRLRYWRIFSYEMTRRVYTIGTHQFILILIINKKIGRIFVNEVLASINDDANEINTITLSMLPEDVKRYMRCDTFSNSNDCGAFTGMEPSELLHSLKIYGLPNHYLDLKVGVPIILLKNSNQSIGLYNSTRLIVSKIGIERLRPK